MSRLNSTQLGRPAIRFSPMDSLHSLPSARLPKAAASEVSNAGKAGGAETSTPETSFGEVLERTLDKADAGAQAMERAVQGAGSLDTTQLLRLQAQVYRYSETVELVSKVTEKTTSAAKTVIQSQ